MHIRIHVIWHILSACACLPHDSGVMLTRCGSCHSRAHCHTLFAGLNGDSVFPELSARARVPQRCSAYRSARQLSGALRRKLTWLTQTINQVFVVAKYTSVPPR